jgi:hypothetical protein
VAVRHGGLARGCAVKAQAPGPITLAAELELVDGHWAITDLGAVRDIAASLVEWVAADVLVDVLRSYRGKSSGAAILQRYRWMLRRLRLPMHLQEVDRPTARDPWSIAPTCSAR